MFTKSTKIFALITVWVFILNLFYASFVWVDFKINQDYIADNLCIEKDIEESTCNGSCHLKKELEKVEENKGNSKEEPINISQSRIDVFLLTSVVKHTEFISVINTQISFGTPKSEVLKGYSTQIFHPPIIIS